MYPQAKIRLKRHQTEPQSNTGANTPQDHGVGEREIRYSFTLAVIHRLTTCKPSPQEGQFINQQAKIVFDSHRTECQRTTSVSTPQDRGGEGKQKEDAVKLVVHWWGVGGGDRRSATIYDPLQDPYITPIGPQYHP